MVILEILTAAHLFHFLSKKKVLDQTHNPSTPKINRMMLQVQN